MTKEISLFLGYTNGDFSDEQLLSGRPTSVMAALEKLNEERLNQIRALKLKLGVSLVSLPGREICPGSPAARNFLQDKIKLAQTFDPDIIWLDHLRFEGHWEAVLEQELGFHPTCDYCKGRPRTEIISELAEFARANVHSGVKLGYFAVPFKEVDFNGLMGFLGQDHKSLGNIFDFVSPMLYHRMIGKPTSYIKEYVQYLAQMKLRAKVLPIVQVKDMPDVLPDNLSFAEIKDEVEFSLIPPSLGVAIFCWDHVIEKNKLDKISKILREIK